MSLQNSKLLTFLASHKVESGSGQETHQLGFDRSLYRIPDAELTEFYNVYCQYVDAGYGGITMLEKMTRVGPLRVDLDFIYEGKHPDHLHTQKNTTDFIQGYMAEVAKYMSVTEITDVYVMQKVDPTYYPAKNHTKSGIHLVVPSIRTNKFIEHKVRDAMLKQMETYFPGLPIKGWNDAYDKLVLGHSTFWPLLGSKKPDKDGGQPLPYKLVYVAEWDPADGKVAVDDDREHGISPALVRKFSVRALPTEESPTTLLGAKFTMPEDDARISGGGAAIPQRGRPAQRPGEPGSRESSPNRVIYQQPLTDAQKAYYGHHVDNLADNRYTEYGEWVNVAICLKNIHPTDLNELWHTFSQKAQEKYDWRETEAKWMSLGFRNDGAKLGVGSLRFWSRNDNYTRYLEIEKSNIDHLIKESVLSQTEHDVAQVVYAKYRDEFKCAKYGANVWYRFLGHVWRETDRGIALQLRLSSDVTKEYRHYVFEQDRLMNMIAECPPGKHDPNTCDMCQAEKKKKSYTDIIKALKKTGFKKSVMDECRELFLDEEFANKVDENKRLIAFRNGVLDMTTTPPVFRDGKPEDYISFCTNLDFDPKKPYYQYDCWSELNKFLHDVLPDAEVRTYFMAYLANALSGENDAQKFHILTGEGSNGKSMLMILMSTTMGDYACTAPISLLTQGRNKSAAAAPELVRMKGRRFVTMQEPDEQVPLNTGLMKELASSEKITARDLYAGSKQMLDFELQARFNLACNEKPKINTTDNGTWRRLVVVGFPNKFVFDPKLPHEKLMNESMKQNCMSEQWATAFLSYLVHLFTEGKGLRKLAAPDKVMEYIAEYKEDSDVIAKFIREKIHPLPDMTETEQRDPTSWSSITTAFGDWKRQNELMGKGTPTELKKRIEGIHKKMPKGGWTTFRCGDA
jgi:P4 family phage/plasmid primase-like protien